MVDPYEYVLSQGEYWQPPSIDWESFRWAAFDQWRYVLIEEVVDGVAELCQWPWPLTDQNGRLIWLPEYADAVEVAAVSVELMRMQMYEPNGLQRVPRPGDTLACLAHEELLGAWVSISPADPVTLPVVEDVREIFPRRVFDITAEARAASKLAYLAASTAVFDIREIDDLPDAAEPNQQVDESPNAELRVIGPHGHDERPPDYLA